MYVYIYNLVLWMQYHIISKNNSLKYHWANWPSFLLQLKPGSKPKMLASLLDLSLSRPLYIYVLTCPSFLWNPCWFLLRRDSRLLLPKADCIWIVSSVALAPVEGAKALTSEGQQPLKHDQASGLSQGPSRLKDCDSVTFPLTNINPALTLFLLC